MCIMYYYVLNISEFSRHFFSGTVDVLGPPNVLVQWSFVSDVSERNQNKWQDSVSSHCCRVIHLHQVDIWYHLVTYKWALTMPLSA